MPDTPRVLIVEDDPDVRQMMEHFVAMSGYEVMSASNGLVALEAMRQRRPCAVLLDMHMPVMDGFEFRRRQVADRELAGVPVLCITAAYDPRAVSSELGVPCMGKPADLATISRQLADICTRSPNPF